MKTLKKITGFSILIFTVLFSQNIFSHTSKTIIEQDENKICISGPSFNFNKKGFFKKPKIIKKFIISDEKDYSNSLNESVDYFFKKVFLKKKFTKTEFLKSILSNSLLLE